MPKLATCLWFDGKAEQAANFYTSLFPDGKILDVSRYGEEGKKVHGQPVGSVMVVNFEIMGQQFTGLNGGPHFKFSEAISFEVHVDGQQEVDHYWNALAADGGAESQCGWLKDKFGVSWQIIPKQLMELLTVPDKEKAGRVTNAMLKMKKIIIQDLQDAHDGEQA